MKIICTKSDLLKGINTVIKAVPGKTTMPVLECILIDASSGQIKFTANDMELAIETRISGAIIEPGIIALEARLFSDIIRKFPDSEITIETGDRYQTKISCGKAVLTITGRDSDEFPGIPVIDRSNHMEISQMTLRDVIQQTIFAISIADTNKMMTGELFEINENEWRVVALDGHRIAIRKILLKKNYGNRKIIVPGKALTEIAKILPGESEDTVDIFFTDNHIMFEFDTTIMVSRLIEGNYFRIDQMLSTDYVTKFTANRRELLDCIDRATLLVKESDKKPIILNILDDTVEIRIDSQLGSMDEEISISKEGKDMLIGFNPRYMIDALKAIDEETVGLYFVNSKAPCFIRDEDQSYIYLVLPVNFVS